MKTCTPSRCPAVVQLKKQISFLTNDVVYCVHEANGGCKIALLLLKIYNHNFHMDNPNKRCHYTKRQMKSDIEKVLNIKEAG